MTEDAAPSGLVPDWLVRLTIAACVRLGSWYAVSVHVHAQGQRAQLLATHHFLEASNGAALVCGGRVDAWTREAFHHDDGRG